MPIEDDQTFQLAASTYDFRLLSTGYVTIFPFKVDADGTVTILDLAQGTGGAGQLNLIVHPVLVNVGGYPGKWYTDPTGVVVDNQILNLVAATYRFSLYLTSGVVKLFDFTVDTGGNVSSLDPDFSKHATGGSNLTLITHPVAVSVGGYPGRWSSDGIGDDTPIGDKTLHLAAAHYHFRLLLSTYIEMFEFTVDLEGKVTTSDDHRGIAGPESLNLVTHAIDPRLSRGPNSLFACGHLHLYLLWHIDLLRCG